MHLKCILNMVKTSRHLHEEQMALLCFRNGFSERQMSQEQVLGKTSSSPRAPRRGRRFQCQRHLGMFRLAHGVQRGRQPGTRSSDELNLNEVY